MDSGWGCLLLARECAVLDLCEEERGILVKIVIIRSPRLLAPLLGRLFGVSSNPKKDK